MKNNDWRDCVGIEPTKPDTQVSVSFEDYEGHQYPIQTRIFYVQKHFRLL
jgi:hypothetical protein